MLSAAVGCGLYCKSFLKKQVLGAFLHEEKKNHHLDFQILTFVSGVYYLQLKKCPFSIGAHYNESH